MATKIQVSSVDPATKRTKFVHLRGSQNGVKVEGDTRCFLGHKIPGPGEVDGIFAEWEWKEGKLTARTDRYGIYPLLYFHKNNEICLSPSLEVLLERGAEPELDLESLGVFLRLGFFLGEDTAFKSIRLLPPNAHLEWSAERCSISGGVQTRPAEEISIEAALLRYRELFSAAIERRTLPGVTCLPLSGGRDSRHILFELVRQNRAPDYCATMKYDAPYSSEDEVAALVCRTVGVRHLTIDAATFQPRLEEAKNSLTNFCTDEHRWIFELSQNIAEEQQFFFDGAAGDVLSAGHFLDDKRLELYEARDFEALAEHLLAPDFPDKLVPGWARAGVRRDKARQRLTRELERHVDAANPVGSFFFWNRTRRVAALAPYTILESIGTAVVPFVDHALWDFLSSLPASMFLDHSFHTRAISESYPEFAHLPYANKTELQVSSSVLRRRAWGLLRFLDDRDNCILRRSAYRARLLRCVVDPKYYLSMGLDTYMIYLAQLGTLVAARTAQSN